MFLVCHQTGILRSERAFSVLRHFCLVLSLSLRSCDSIILSFSLSVSLSSPLSLSLSLIRLLALSPRIFLVLFEPSIQGDDVVAHHLFEVVRFP